MCTLSFVPRLEGYAVGMNRDELRSRVLATPPRMSERDRILAVYPAEPEGGTWIAVNQFGLLLALLNWNLAVAGNGPNKQKSRGTLIPEIIRNRDLGSVEPLLRPQRLHGMLPFHLVGIDPQRALVQEWRWDGESLTGCEQPWSRRHWFSSSLSDTEAMRLRGAVCESVAATASPTALDWLTELHRSHRPARGPYSLCVHRPDAVTVSYTEVLLDPRQISVRYLSGSPCEAVGFHHVLEIPRSETFLHRPALIA